MNKSAKSNTIRIIAGQWRGRRLPVLDREGLRPTTDRVRETVFNWLMHDIAGARCLDLFAGSGALGLECLSRGACFVQFVESDRGAEKNIVQNLSALAAEPSRYSSLNADALTFLREKVMQPFDIIFLDPPFGSKLLAPSIDALVSKGWLAEEGLVYIEQGSKADSPNLPEHWECYRKGKAGQARYELFTV